jgi:hypothetical protein
MKSMLFAGAIALVLVSVAPASAKPWVDWSPKKGVWQVTAVKVDPNHIDDYLTGLKKVWVPGEEYAKQHGLIDMYDVMVKVNAADGQANVLLVEHLTSFGMLDPNKKRDQDMEAAMDAMMSQDQQKGMVEGFDKYRTFVGDDMWQSVEFAK